MSVKKRMVNEIWNIKMKRKEEEIKTAEYCNRNRQFIQRRVTRVSNALERRVVNSER